MFARRPRIETITRLFLTAVVLFNALASPTVAFAKPAEQEKSFKPASQPASHMLQSRDSTTHPFSSADRVADTFVSRRSSAAERLACNHANDPVITNNGVVYLATRGEIGRSRDFYATPSGTPNNTPTWQMVQGGLPVPMGTSGGILEFVLDPGCSFQYAWAAVGDPVSGGSGAVWRTLNLNDPAPTWTQVLSMADIATALGEPGSSLWVKRIQISEVDPNRVVIAVSLSGRLYVGVSGDYGTTWTWSGDLGPTGTQAIGLELSDHNANKLWVGATDDGGTGKILYSDDAGTTFTALGSLGTAQAPYDIHAPKAENPDDQLLYTLTRPTGTSNLAVVRSQNGGTSWTTGYTDGYGPLGLDRFLFSHPYNNQSIYTSHVSYTNGVAWAFASSADGGSSWPYIYYTGSYRLSAAWGFPANTQYVLAAGHDSKLAWYSSNNGADWTGKTMSNWTATYSGAPGAAHEAGPVTIVDAAALAGVYPQVLNATMTVSPTGTLVANGQDTVTVTVNLKDSSGNPLAGHQVRLNVTGSENILHVGEALTNIATSNGSGNAVFTLASTHAEEKTLTATDLTQNKDLNVQVQVTFVHGPLDDIHSRLEASPAGVPADGRTPITLTVTARDENDNPISGVNVVLRTLNGSAVLTQPEGVTDAQGRAQGSIVDAVREEVTVAATVNSLPLNAVTVKFEAPDLHVSVAAPSQSLPGKAIQYTLTASNPSQAQAQDVTLTLDLPAGVTYTSVYPTTPTVDVNGQTLTWLLPSLDPGSTLSFAVGAEIASTVAVDTVLQAHATLYTPPPSTDENPKDNEDATSTLIVEGNAFSVGEWDPAKMKMDRTISIGASTSYELKISNLGLLDGRYQLQVTDLDSAWISFAENNVELTEPYVSLKPGETTTVLLTVHVPADASCTVARIDPYRFTVTVKNMANESTVSRSDNLRVQSTPVFSNLSPSVSNGTIPVVGSSDVTLRWSTDVPSQGALKFFPVTEPGNITTLSEENSSTSHVIVVPDLAFEQTYEWYVEASSSCATGSSSHEQFTIGKGIVFTKSEETVSIPRDYDQRVSISVRNEDSDSYTLTAAVENPYEDLIVNFIEGGSQGQPIILEGNGKTTQLVLALHAQDAQLESYDLPLSLTAVSVQSPTKQIHDQALLHVTVLSDGDFSIVKDGPVDDLTLGQGYLITNHGNPITDLSLSAVDPVTGEPTRILLRPSLDHVRLETGQSIRVVAYPIFTAADMGGMSSANEGSAHTASAVQVSGLINYVLQGFGAGKTVTYPPEGQQPASTSCTGTKQVRAVQIQNMTCNFETMDWYCTNRPDVTTPIQVPAWLTNATLKSILAQLTFLPNSNVQPHSGTITFNGTSIGSFTEKIPTGQFSLSVPTSSWNNSQAGSAVQSIGINTTHLNGGHYVTATGFNVQASVSQATTYVCAEAAADPLPIVQQAYGCSTTSSFNWQTGVYPGSVWNNGENKSTNSSSTENDGAVSTSACAQASCGDPINTNNGAFSFTQADLSLPTAAGNLVFQRSYSSAAVDQYTSPLGYGWAHNHEAKLIFPDPEDTSDMKDFVLFQSVMGNQYLFHIESDGSYTPGPGVLATLVHSGDVYRLTAKDQGIFEFDSNGRLSRRQEATDHFFQYDYTADRLKISADGGPQFLEIYYDAQGRVDHVRDSAEREVDYHYDALTGDLISVTDVLGQEWEFQYEHDVPDHSTHRLTQVLDPNKKPTVRTEYDMQGRAFRQLDGNGDPLTTLVHNGDGSTTVYDALKHPQKHEYDGNGVNTKVIDPLGYATVKQPGNNFRPETIQEPEGQTTTLTWSENGANLTQILNASGPTDIDYNELNQPTRVEDPLGHETRYVYGDSNFPTLPTRVEVWNGSTLLKSTLYSYYAPNSGQPAGTLEQVTAQGLKTHYTYTSSGQVDTVTTAYETSYAQTTDYDYDDWGQVIRIEDPNGVITRSQYDAAGRLLISLYNVDPALDPTIDPDHPLDEQGIPANVVSSDGKDIYNLFTHYAYDARGNQIAVTDPNGIVTRTYYDGADRVVTVVENLTAQGFEEPTPPARGSAADENLRTDTIYAEDGTAIATIDPAGITTRTYYDAAGRPVTVVQNLVGQAISGAVPPGRGANDRNIRTDTVYDKNGNVIATLDPLGTITRTYYDNLNRPVTVVQNLVGQSIAEKTPPDYGSNGQNIRTDTMYDANGRVIATIDPAQVITRTYYDGLDRPVTVVKNLLGDPGDPNPPARPAPAHRSDPTDANIRTDTVYDANGNPIATIDPKGIITRTYYNEANQPVTVIQNLVGQTIEVSDPPDPGNSHENIRTEIAYDPHGRKDTSTDPLNRVTKYEYNHVGQVVQMTENYQAGHDPNDQDKFNLITAYRYDVAGQQTTVTDTLGRVTLNSYDPVGHLLSSTQNYSSEHGLNEQNQYNIITSYTYDAAGNRRTTTDAKTHTTDTTYNDLNRPVIVRDGNGDPTTTSYDAAGNVKSITDAEGNPTSFTYNKLGQQTVVKDAQDHETRYLYTARGQVALKTDANNFVTRYEYDSLGRLSAVTENFQAGISADAQTNVRTEYSYDANDNRLTILDGKGHTTTFAYDELNRLTHESDAMGHAWEYGYDALGNRVSMLDAKRQLTEYIYDEAGRLSSINYPDPDPDVSFTYDAAGRRLKMTDGSGQTTWLYDKLNRAETITHATSPTDPAPVTVGYGYDPVGNRAALTYPGGQTFDYLYDDANRLTDVTDEQSPVAHYEYYATGQLKQVTRPNQVTTLYHYYTNGWLQDLTHFNGPAALASYHYQYDNVGNRTQALEEVKQQIQVPPTSTATSLPTETASPTLEASATPTASGTPENAATPTDTGSPTATETPTPLTPQGRAPANHFVAFVLPQAGKALFAPAYQEEPTATPTETPTETSTATLTATLTPTPRVDDSYTVSLLHMNGEDGSTTFTDESDKTWTTYGNAQIDTAQSEFGGASAFSDGTGDYIRANGSSDFAFGTGDFTIDFWVRFSSVGAAKLLYDSRPGAQGVYPVIYINASNKIAFHVNSADRIVGTTTIATNAWYHIAVTRSNTNTRLFINGIQEGATYSDTNNYLNGANRPLVLNGYDGNYAMAGWIDELRVSKGIARWTSNFTPPAAEYVFTIPTVTYTPTVTATPTETSTPTLTPTNTATMTMTLTPALPMVTAIDGRGGQMCVITSSGGVKCWGFNGYGQVGDGTTTTRLTPVDVSGLTSGVTALAAGYYYTCAVTSGGGVKCWGQNTAGQLGDGTTTQRLTPVNVSGLSSGVSSLAAGGSHTCALMTDGSVKCWGSNTAGQLGDGTTTNRLTPVNVSGLSGVVAVRASGGSTCALTATGGVKCWGDNTYGQLGDGTTTTRLTPVNVSGLTSGVTAITAGAGHMCALTSTGGVKCWGWNHLGQLGDGSYTNRTTPTDVVGFTSGIVAIDSSYYNSCAITSSAGVRCWGTNYYGEQGDGSLTGGAIALGTSNGNACALMSNGGVKCWGNNGDGTLGDGTTTSRAAPAYVSGLTGGPIPTPTITSTPSPTPLPPVITAIDEPNAHGCALTSSGGVKCWGWNYYGQIGDGTTANRLAPVDVSGLTSGVTALAGGAWHNCVLTTSGSVKCWGANESGQLGDGTTTQRLTSVNVSGLASGVAKISAGSSHTCAVTTSGGVKCWGSNLRGGIGDGTTTNRLTPVNVSGLTSGVAAVSVGGYHTCALTTSGGVKCWGANESGELGDNTTTDRLTPVNVSGLTSGVVAISAGDNHTCALTSSGGIKCWGSNSDGQIGDGTTTNRLIPVNVSGLASGAAGVEAGNFHTCAVTTSGGAKCWGSNVAGGLGDGTYTTRTTPVDVVGLTSGVSAVSAGGPSCALTTGGGVLCWGSNNFGELGDGTLTRRPTPAYVSGLTGIPAPTPTFTPTNTPTPTPTFTPTFTPTNTATPTDTPTLPPLPDLLILNVSIELEHINCLHPGDSLGVRVVVKNNGQLAAGSFVVEVNGVEQTVEGLGIGETTTVFFSGYSNPVTVHVDSTNLVTESDESNNVRSEMVAVPTQPLPCTSTPTLTPTITDTPTPTDTSTPTFTPTPTEPPSGPVRIDYVYDPLNRLKEANYYSTGDFYHYEYDEVGNRSQQTRSILGVQTTTEYGYDDANRLISVDGMTYTWDANGNLLSDGVNSYDYDAANRLIAINGSITAAYAYNGLGDRLQETVGGQTTTFTMDLNAGLTQALSDGTNTYVYGVGRLAQTHGSVTEYFLNDALGSVRQLTDASGAITYAGAYDPYGTVTSTFGDSSSAYGYTGEYTSNDLVYLRARHYAPSMGRFLTRDTWGGDANDPMSFNRWSYVQENPINLTDPTGLCPTCFVYFFPGAGNKGDTDNNNNLDDNLGDHERDLVNALRQRGITTIPVYPYGAGLRTNWTEDNPIFGQDTNGNFRYAILPSAYNTSKIPKTKADEIQDYFDTCREENKWNITFIGYSGGGQMAYSTAQKLTGRIFVDDLVLLGAPFRAYNGLGNIGHIWDLVAQNDTGTFGKGGEKELGWDRYNSGYRNIPTYGEIYVPDEDIYQHGATKCTLYGPQYIHYGDGDYLEANLSITYPNGVTQSFPFNGISCSGSGVLPGFPIPANDKSRLENLVNFLFNVVGIGRPK